MVRGGCYAHVVHCSMCEDVMYGYVMCEDVMLWLCYGYVMCEDVMLCVRMLCYGYVMCEDVMDVVVMSCVRMLWMLWLCYGYKKVMLYGYVMLWHGTFLGIVRCVMMWRGLYIGTRRAATMFSPARDTFLYEVRLKPSLVYGGEHRVLRRSA